MSFLSTGSSFPPETSVASEQSAWGLEGTKVAVVTGAAYGNGRAIAIELAARGADVVVADLDEKRAGETAEMVDAKGRRAHVVVADVSVKRDVEKIFHDALDEFGRVDILVNNAGITDHTPLVEISEETWDRLIDVNLKGTFLCSQQLASILIPRGQPGKIVNITSVNADRAYPDEVPYEAAKAGVRMMTCSLALDLARHKINVNAVAPGLIRTGMTEERLQDEENVRAFLRYIPWGRIGEPSDIACAVAFLASDDADYITGTMLFVDGGWHVQ
jgi:NAD(P)-dependent dehydrogenase (short-subunit alcohol dehydrogenase family)